MDQVSDDEEAEEDDYEYIEEDASEEDEFVSKKKSSKNLSRITKKENYEAEKPKKHKGKLTKDKVSNIDESEESPQNKGLDIRKAFFKAAQQPKMEKQKTEANANEDDDDLAMEIMKELNQVTKYIY